MRLDRVAELAQRREALQLQAADERRAVARHLDALRHGFDPLRRAARLVPTAVLLWRLWRRLRRH